MTPYHLTTEEKQCGEESYNGWKWRATAYEYQTRESVHSGSNDVRLGGKALADCKPGRTRIKATARASKKRVVVERVQEAAE